MPVIVIVADGARPDTLANAMDRGITPSLRALRDEGSMQTVTTVFPSVTGPAYAPFLMGRYPGPIGLPGLRWYDRTRTTCRMPGNSRSYVGVEMKFVDRDIDASAPTIFELAPSSIAALSVIGRGLPSDARIGTGLRFIMSTARTHFTGHVPGWLGIDRDIAGEVATQIELRNPDFVFAALTGIDKSSHSLGHTSAYVDNAMRIVDDLVARVRASAEKTGRWDQTHVWIVSDHGHSPVKQHDDLAGLVRQLGFRTIAHPFVYAPRGEVAMMVSGNAMAHVYLDLAQRTRPYLPELGGRWAVIREALLARDSVDLMILPVSPGACEIHGSRGRGHAMLTWGSSGISYEALSGDPLAVGTQRNLSDDDAYDRCLESDYPDALVQLARLSDSPRCGEIILSASRNWDFRAKWEPIPHESSHGALHREHMLVPLLTSHPVNFRARRTVDVMPSALKALGLSVPSGLDGVSFF